MASAKVCYYGHTLAVDESKSKLITCVRCHSSIANKPFLHCETCQAVPASKIELCEACVFELKKATINHRSMTEEELIARKLHLAQKAAEIEEELATIERLLAVKQS